MNINSDRAEVKEKTFFLSKIPVYLMYLLFLIPHRSDKKWKYAVGFMTCGIHLLGFMVMIIRLYAIAKFYQGVPQIPVYILLAPTFGLLIFTYLFIYKSWVKDDNLEMLSLLDKTSTPKAWDVKHKILVVFLTSIVILLVTLRIWSFDEPFYDSVKKALIFQFITGNEVTKDYLAFSTSIYNNYVFTILYLFPVYISYVCLCVNIIITKSHKLLDDVKGKNLTIDDNMEKFMEYLNTVINLVSKADEIYNANIFWFLTVSLSNMTNCLMAIYLDRCHYFDKRFQSFVSDAFGLLVLTTMAQSISTRVSAMPIFFSKFQLKPKSVQIWPCRRITV